MTLAAGAPDYRTRVVADLSTVDRRRWQALLSMQAGGGRPFVDWRYLCALEQSGSVGRRSGWAPCHLVVERGDDLVAAAPLYRKAHSYGEYVFDWAWADAYRRNGLDYYPKGLVAVPFTPVPGPRLLAIDAPSREALVAALLALARGQDWSSLHLLFPQDEDAVALTRAGLLERHGVQFHWQNPGFADFDAYLASLTQPKRKKILAERRKVREAGVRTRCVAGDAIGDGEWAHFYRCYAQTYALHGSTPYLTPRFFTAIGAAMPEHLLMVVAEREADGEPIAASLLFHDGEALYGRYWGAVAHVPCLHFEASYYTPIEWAIANRIGRFEGGAQGEHKMARGFLPVPTRSFHWLAHPAFNEAVGDYLRRERGGIDEYLDELRERSPLRQPAGP